MSEGWERYYRVVRRIPVGRITNYGTVAGLAGAPRNARQVGYALAALHGTGGEVPWHRVLGADGPARLRILLDLSPGAAGDEQRRRLEREGVDVDARGRVDAAPRGWGALEDGATGDEVDDAPDTPDPADDVGSGT